MEIDICALLMLADEKSARRFRGSAGLHLKLMFARLKRLYLRIENAARFIENNAVTVPKICTRV